jgi:cytochrome c oxidase cbb3-type subunit III
MPTKTEKDSLTGHDTTGHEWDGIRELNTPLPKWWIYTFVATVLFSGVYCVLYPSVPWLHSHFAGVLNYTNRAELERSLAAGNEKRSAYLEKIAAASLEEIQNNPDLFNFAMVGGRVAFNDNCAACHRVGGAGAKGYPSLADDDWLWGGSLAQIHQTITYGIRNANPKSRQSQMPRFGADGILKPAEIGDVADYVRSLSGQPGVDETAIGRGRKIFAENCAACHGEGGKGNPELGAKNLADGIWLYGGDKDTLVETITNARNGAMPAWGERLDPTTIKMLAVYVHGLGGGK